MLEPTPTAVMFPGQGSQTPRMRELVAAVRPDLLCQVAPLVGDDPFDRVDESTRFAQPAIFCASLAGWERVRDHLDPVAFAGHSLGELTALVAAGSLDERDALRLAVLRGLLMSIFGEDAGGGTMLAIRGATPAQAAALAARNGVTFANDNAHGQAVLSGSPAALAMAREDALGDGLRTAELDVAGAFHLGADAGRRGPLPRGACRDRLRRAVGAGRLVRHGAAVRRPARGARRGARAAGALARDDDRARRRRRAELRRRRTGRVLAELAPRCVPGAGAASLDMLLGDLEESRAA